MQQILASEFSDIQLAALLGALAARGETPAEIAGFVDAMRSAATPLPLTTPNASAHRHLRHRRRRSAAPSTSPPPPPSSPPRPRATGRQARQPRRHLRCGSADVLEALGIPVDLAPDEAAAAPPHPSLRLPPRARAASRHEGGHARSPRPRRPHRLQSPRPTRQSRWSPRSGHGRLTPPSRPARRRSHVAARNPPRLRSPRQHRSIRRQPWCIRRALHLRPQPDRRGPHPTRPRSKITLSTVTPEQFGLTRAPVAALPAETPPPTPPSSAASSPANTAPPRYRPAQRRRGARHRRPRTGHHRRHSTRRPHHRPGQSHGTPRSPRDVLTRVKFLGVSLNSRLIQAYIPAAAGRHSHPTHCHHRARTSRLSASSATRHRARHRRPFPQHLRHCRRRPANHHRRQHHPLHLSSARRPARTPSP